MLSPTPRLLWLTFWLLVPVLTLAGVDTRTLPDALILLLLFLAILVRDAILLRNTLQTVRLTSTQPPSAYKDRSGSVNLTIEKPLNLGLVQVVLVWPNSFEIPEPSVPASISCSIGFTFVPHARGEFLITQAYLLGGSRWGLWKMRAQRELNLKLQVFPDLSKDPASRKLFAVFQQGQRVQRVIGRGREVERLRDYAPGDSFDEVYWKATARRGSPVSKVFQVERTQDIYAIVDGSRLGARNEALERFVTASLLLAVAAEKNSDNFGLITFHQKVEHFVRASRGKGHFHHCRNAIFDLQPAPVSPDFGELFTFINLRLRKRALLFFLTDLSDPLLAETFLKGASLVARRHVVMVDQIADSGDRPLFHGTLPESESDVRDRLAGHLQWEKLRELERTLSHLGIRMQLLKPEHTTTDLIGQYMSIKQRQLL